MSLLATRMQNLRSTSRLDQWEVRASQYGALDLTMVQTADPNGLVSRDLAEKAVRSIGRTLEVPVINYNSGISISNARSLTISDAYNTSAMQSISFVTYSWGFTIVPSHFMNNELAIQDEFNRQMEQWTYLFAKTLDAAALTAMNNAKAQKLGNTLGSRYSLVGNTVQTAQAQRERFLADITPLQASNDVIGAGTMHVLGDPSLQSLVLKLSENGAANAENKAIQFLDKRFYFTNQITNGAGVDITAYAMPGRSVGMVSRFEREALLNRQTSDGHRWGIERLPFVDMLVGTYFYEGVGDYSADYGAATADNTRAYKEHYGFSVDVAFFGPYLSAPTTVASPIMKLEVLTS
jgi:hypothetical protein